MKGKDDGRDWWEKEDRKTYLNLFHSLQMTCCCQQNKCEKCSNGCKCNCQQGGECQCQCYQAEDQNGLHVCKCGCQYNKSYQRSDETCYLWSKCSDQLLVAAVKKFGKKWIKIQKLYFQKRTPNSLKKRYQYLNKSGNINQVSIDIQDFQPSISYFSEISF